MLFLVIFVAPVDVTRESLKEPIQNLWNPNRRYTFYCSALYCGVI